MSRGEEIWALAKTLFLRYRSMHGIETKESDWDEITDEWERGYWYGVADYVLENYVKKGVSP